MSSSSFCKARYFVRAETSYIINFEALFHAAQRLPSASVYFGSIVSHFPTPLLETRVAEGLSHNRLPVHAYGGFYGVSHDVLKRLIQPTTVRTVVRKDISYQVPWQDRAIGLALWRSQTTLKNVYYLNGVYHLCTTASLSCDNNKYTNFVAFKVGNDNAASDTTATSIPEAILKTLTACKSERKSEVELLRIPQNSKSMDSTNWPLEECLNLSAEGQEYLKIVKSEGPVAAAELSEDTTCAEEFYLIENPQAVEMIENGTYKTGRQHIICGRGLEG